MSGLKGKQHLPASRIEISRAIYDERLFDHRFGKHTPANNPGEEPEKRCSLLATLCRRKCTPPKCSAAAVLSWIRSFLPILEWLPKYELKKNLLSDLTGGLTVGIMHIPQGATLFFVYLFSFALSNLCFSQSFCLLPAKVFRRDAVQGYSSVAERAVLTESRDFALNRVFAT